MEFNRNSRWITECIKTAWSYLQQNDHPVQDAAAATIVKSLSQYHSSLNVPRPPSYFKVCQVLHFSEELKIIQLIMPNWPTAITADGCSTNMSAGNKLVENLGLTTPFMR